jgi:hypothetical protein
MEEDNYPDTILTVLVIEITVCYEFITQQNYFIYNSTANCAGSF